MDRIELFLSGIFFYFIIICFSIPVSAQEKLEKQFPKIQTVDDPELEKLKNGVKFKVAKVEQTKDKILMEKGKEALTKKFGEGILASSHSKKHLADMSRVPYTPAYEELGFSRYRVNAFISAVSFAYDQHRPLRISPDMFWLVILQGLNLHLRQNPEKYRKHTVRHSGRMKIEITVNEELLSDPNSMSEWEKILPKFFKKTEKYVSSKMISFGKKRFTTTGRLESIAFQTAVLDTVQDYFEFEADGICGIPYIVLEGSPADWQDLHETVKELDQFGLSWWTEILRPIILKIKESSEGSPDLKFWDDFSKLRNFYAASYMNGWVINFFPYLAPQAVSKGEKRMYRNPYLKKQDSNEGPMLSDFPGGISYIPFHYKPRKGSMKKMFFYSGFLGVSENKDGVVSTEIGWAIRERQLH
ncbi:MAG TPA: DUF4419 domain-containing protein [Leptospiraceae bacterium]|nr:DUF4419 domain-containing protein [Leptospiraceae bacterium]HMY69342.1 DUF4419 domain-containing protein [Leptospiraceae bacterium]HNF26742.1 DUF4419 domain-containing protein [Leptospiraceae bacterium]HNI97051.1 DUF4419 domain-containing protein [Leptospiraceae bacterium]HNM02925.1 DUF4419 domain-containing protein [Leptospiraceae bacterium]